MTLEEKAPESTRQPIENPLNEQTLHTVHVFGRGFRQVAETPLNAMIEGVAQLRQTPSAEWVENIESGAQTLQAAINGMERAKEIGFKQDGTFSFSEELIEPLVVDGTETIEPDFLPQFKRAFQDAIGNGLNGPVGFSEMNMDSDNEEVRKAAVTIYKAGIKIKGLLEQFTDVTEIRMVTDKDGNTTILLDGKPLTLPQNEKLQ